MSEDNARKGFLGKVFKPKSRTVEDEMGFFDHLEVLRWHIIRGVIAIIIAACWVFVNKGFVFDVLIFGPKKPDFWTYRQLCYLSERFGLSADLCIKDIGFTILNIDMAGQFTRHLSISIIGGFILAFPYVFWELWRFIRPALSVKETGYTRGVVFFVSLLFATGVLFGYYIITPLSVSFLGNYQVSPEIANQISLDSYIGLVTTLTMATGLVFQLPIVIYFLSKIGIMTPQFMRTYRQHAVVIILIVSAVITPSPDIPTQLLVALPIFLLYEISIFISASVQRSKRKAEREFYAD